MGQLLVGEPEVEKIEGRARVSSCGGVPGWDNRAGTRQLRKNK